jgi:hypothetical protein
VGEHLEDDRLVDDSLLGSTDLVCDRLNLFSDLVEVCPFLSRNFLWEHRPGLSRVMQMSKSQFQRTTSDNATTSGQEIDTHDRL